MKGYEIGALMTILDKAKKLYPNHHVRLQPKPNVRFQTAAETIYELHVRGEKLVPGAVDEANWLHVATGKHGEIHKALDEKLALQNQIALEDAARKGAGSSNWSS